jgi:hypothetical protein
MKSLKEEGTITSENDKLVISICEFGVTNLKKSVEEWGHLLNLPPTENSLKLTNTELLFHKRPDDVERLVNVKIIEDK